MIEDTYVYPGTSVLRNKLGIVDKDEFERIERQITTQRARERLPEGDFDLAHLRAIHRHLFQDLYEWAGEIRTVEMSKDGHLFQFRRYIHTGMADVHRRLVEQDFLKRLDSAAFADAAGKIIGDVNYVHPFREGNGRTQLIYLKQLAEQAGHPIDLIRLDGRIPWLDASKAALRSDYGLMADAIQFALERKSL